MKKYVYKPYSEIFPVLFTKEKERIIANVISILSIEHIGSTAVPGLGGKGIIDIAIAVHKQDMESVSEQLQSLGYEFRPNFSTSVRFYFIIYLPDPEEETRRYHIHLTVPENEEWKEFISFRDYLKTNPEAAKEYGEMKKQAALEANQDGERYRKLKEPMFEKSRSQLNKSTTSYRLEHYNTIPKEYEEILYQEISNEAFDAKGLAPIYPFSVFIKDLEENVLGGVSGTLFYGSLYVDSLWVNKNLRHQGWGSKLMQEAEKVGREHGARFATLNTMDWEARSFYEKLGYTIEFIREGYEKDSKMFMLRKNL